MSEDEQVGRQPVDELDFPPAEEIVPPWGRQPGKRGRLGKVELEAQAFRDWQLRIVKQLLEALAIARAEVVVAEQRTDEAEAAGDARLAAALVNNESLRRENAALKASSETAAERGELLATVLTQLQVMMPGDELEPEFVGALPAHESAPRSNGQVTVMVEYGKMPRLRLASHVPARKPLAPIYLDVDGIKPNDVVLIAGYLGLPNGPELTKRASETYRQETPEDRPSTDTKGEAESSRENPVHQFNRNLMAAYESMPPDMSLTVTRIATREGFDFDHEDPADPLGLQAEERAIAERRQRTTSGDASN